MLGNLSAAFATVFTGQGLVLVLTGALLGFFLGVLPGLGGAVTLALLTPVTFAMDAEAAIILLLSAVGTIGFGGMITSILLNTPGTPENAATVLDGYAMARQGRAAEAIGAGVAASTLGGLFGLGVLIAVVPVARSLVLTFSYPEFFMMAIFALTVIAVVTQGQAHKGLIAAGLGFMIAFIGLDPVRGLPRFTFGELYLWDGIDVVPALIGLFAGAEMIALYGGGVAVANRADAGAARVSTFAHGVRAALRNWTLILRGGVIGSVIGVVPGVGGVVASFLSYGQAVQTSKTPERFGHGAVEGVVAAESANDAKDGGALLPTVAFGIPGSVSMAMLIGALLFHGVPVGPTLMIERSDLIYLMIVVLLVTKTIGPLLAWGLGPPAARLTRVRPSLLVPIITVLALTGAYALNANMADLLIVLIFSYVGYAMKRWEFSRIAFVIAFILGDLVETSYQQTLASFGSLEALVSRPIPLVLMVLSALVLALPFVQAWKRRRRTGPSTLEVGRATSTAPVGGLTPVDPHHLGAIVFDLVLLAVIGTFVYIAAVDLSDGAAQVPLLIGVPALLGTAAQTVLDSVAAVRDRRQPSEDRATGGSANAAVASGRSEPGSVALAVEGEAPAAAVQQSRREFSYAGWVVAFLLLAYLTSMAVAIPLALIVFFKLLCREGWLLSVVLTAGTSLFVLGLFDTVLGVPLL